jgi:hypothetical protein
MREDLDFLEKFPKDHNGLFIVYDRFTFDDLFRLLLKSDFDHEEALCFILSNCSLSALVFQERIYNKVYKKLSEEDAISPDLAAYKAQLIYALWIMSSRR